MLKFIGKRVAIGILTLLVLSTVVFVLMKTLPGGPFDSDRVRDPRVIEIMERAYNLDKPMHTQYLLYLKDLLHGNMGESFKKSGITVNDMIVRLTPTTMKLGAVALVLSVTLGITLGIISALTKKQWLRSAIVVFATTGVSVPGFLLALLMIYLFTVNLHLLPTMGLTSWKHYIMPALALSFSPVAYMTRMTRSSLSEVLRQDYITMARATGLSKISVMLRHALKNAMLPIVTYMGPLIANLLTDSFVVETMFAIPGIGREFVTAITGRDYPVIMGLTVFIGAFIIVMNLLSDIAAAVVDPRIRLTSK